MLNIENVSSYTIEELSSKNYIISKIFIYGMEKNF